MGGASTRGAAWAFARCRAAVWKPRARHGRVGRPRASTSTPSPRRGRGAKAWEEDGGEGVLPVNPPSPAFRGVRGPRRTRCRAAGPLAPSLGLHSRRKMTSLNRPAPRSPHTPDAIGSVFYAAMCGFAGLRGVCLRGVFILATKPEPTVIEVRIGCLRAPRSIREATIEGLHRSPNTA